MTDLGNQKFKINYCKTKEIDIEYLKQNTIEKEYQQFSIKNLQNYNPIYSRFFEMNENKQQ